jgi:hypothetical protein
MPKPPTIAAQQDYLTDRRPAFFERQYKKSPATLRGQGGFSFRRTDSNRSQIVTALSGLEGEPDSTTNGGSEFDPASAMSPTAHRRCLRHARRLRARGPVAEAGFTRKSLAGFPALVAVLRRPIIHVGFCRSQRQQRRNCNRRNHKLPHSFLPRVIRFYTLRVVYLPPSCNVSVCIYN